MPPKPTCVFIDGSPGPAAEAPEQRIATVARSRELSSAPRDGGSSAQLLFRQYGTAFSLVFLALLFTLVLRPLFPYPFFFLFFPAVMGAAWFGGPVPGLFAVLLSTIAVDYFLVPPFYSFAINATDVTYFAAFVLCSFAASWVSSLQKKAPSLARRGA